MSSPSRLSLVLLLAYAASLHFSSMTCAQAAEAEEGDEEIEFDEANVDEEEMDEPVDMGDEEGEEEENEEEFEDGGEDGDDEGGGDEDEEGEEGMDDEEGDEGSEMDDYDGEGGASQGSEEVIASFVNKQPNPVFLFWQAPGGDEQMLGKVNAEAAFSLTTFPESDILLRGGETADSPLLVSFKMTAKKTQTHILLENGQGFSPTTPDSVALTIENKGSSDVDIMWINPDEKVESKIGDVKGNGNYNVTSYAHHDFVVRKTSDPTEVVMKFTTSEAESQTFVVKGSKDEL